MIAEPRSLSPDPRSPNWFAIWTRSRHEKQVRDQLDKKHVEVFLPTIGKWSHWKDRKKKIDWPLFPGYVFARFVPDERIGVLKVDGVVQIISNNGVLSSIPDEEIESIRTLVESELAYDPVPLIKEGDMVKVTHGPLRGVVGRLVRKGAHARLVLSVDLIGQAVAVEVDASDVKPVLTMKIGNIELDSPFVVSPMAGMTDTAFRRLVKRQGGCGLVVSEMVSSEGLVRGIDRTLEYAEYTEEERPVSIQIFGGEPAKMAEAARVVEAMGADIVDVNMGCPVPKIAKHNAGCSLMREPEHAAEIIAAMTRAVKIPVTVKMRKGWDDGEVNAPELAKRVEAAGASAIAVHGRTAKQSYSGFADWDVVAGIARAVSIPVFGSGDCIEPEDIVARMRSGVSGVFVGRGVLRNPWILAQARDLMAGLPARRITDEERGQFLLDYLALLLADEKGEQEGFRHGFADGASGFGSANVVSGFSRTLPAVGREKWVINKLRALCTWYTKGFEGGSQFRIGVNSARSIAEVEALVANFFLTGAGRRAS